MVLFIFFLFNIVSTYELAILYPSFVCDPNFPQLSWYSSNIDSIINVYIFSQYLFQLWFYFFMVGFLSFLMLDAAFSNNLSVHLG